jgi:histidinol-phosphate aminotransferase
MKFRKEVLNINPYKPGKPIEEVKRALGLSTVYKLASNEIPFVGPFLEVAFKKEAKNMARYPEATSFYLRDLLSKRLNVGKDNIVLGNGSDEIITLALRAIIDKGDEVIVAYPTFLIYELQAKIYGAKVTRVPLKDLRYSLEAIAAKVSKKTKIIFIANPDNPTGSYLNYKEIKEFLSKIPKDIVVFFDEAYYEFAPADFPRSLELLKKRGNIIIARTFSKAYGLAGLRIGYGITTKECADVLNSIREPFNVNRFAQAAACEALKNKSFVSQVVSYINKEKDYLYKELDICGLTYTKSATNFILVDFKEDTQNLFDYLLKKGIIVRALSGWGLPNFFRVTVGLEKENKAFIKYLKNYLKDRLEETK